MFTPQKATSYSSSKGFKQSTCFPPGLNLRESPDRSCSMSHSPSSVSGVVGESVVSFNVVNLTKPDSLFAMGMRPVLYSHKDAETRGIGWRRCGHGIDYRR